MIPHATFGTRTLALIIDSLVLNGLSFVGGFLIAFTVELMMYSVDASTLNLLLVVAGLTGGWLYYAGSESSVHQATIGKRVLGIKVADLNGRRVSFY